MEKEFSRIFEIQELRNNSLPENISLKLKLKYLKVLGRISAKSIINL